MYLVFTRIPGVSYCRRFRSLLLCLCLLLFQAIMTTPRLGDHQPLMWPSGNNLKSLTSDFGILLFKASIKLWDQRLKNCLVSTYMWLRQEFPHDELVICLFSITYPFFIRLQLFKLLNLITDDKQDNQALGQLKLKMVKDMANLKQWI